MNLIARACEVDEDSDSQCEDPTEVLAAGGCDVPVQVELKDVSPDKAAMVAALQATSQPLVDGGEEAAVSQHSSGKEKLSEPEVTPPKKRRKVASIQDESMKVKLKKEKATSDTGKDRMLHCLFEGSACIPLWPQYDMSVQNKTTYVKVAPYEK